MLTLPKRVSLILESEHLISTYSRLIDQARYDLAVPLLNDRSITITEIAHELDYANVAHFSRAFRRYGGMLPSSYRRLQG